MLFGIGPVPKLSFSLCIFTAVYHKFKTCDSLRPPGSCAADEHQAISSCLLQVGVALFGPARHVIPASACQRLSRCRCHLRFAVHAALVVRPCRHKQGQAVVVGQASH